MIRRGIIAGARSNSTVSLTRGMKQVEPAERLSSTAIGTAYEMATLAWLTAHPPLDMELKRMGGKGDGGIDLQGWWNIPSSAQSRCDRLRIIIQCKGEIKQIGPNILRELEGTLRAEEEYKMGSTELKGLEEGVERYSNELDGQPCVAMLVCQSGFSPATLRRAFNSECPTALMHLSPLLTKEQLLSREINRRIEEDELIRRLPTTPYECVSFSLNNAAR
jgi:hypothetical protein